MPLLSWVEIGQMRYCLSIVEEEMVDVAVKVVMVGLVAWVDWEGKVLQDTRVTVQIVVLVETVALGGAGVGEGSVAMVGLRLRRQRLQRWCVCI